jgi:hypothetical protein
MEEEEECVRGTFCHDTFFFSEDGILRTLRFPPDLDLTVVLDDSGETSTERYQLKKIVTFWRAQKTR